MGDPRANSRLLGVLGRRARFPILIGSLCGVVGVPLQAQTEPGTWSLSAGVASPFGEMKSRNVQVVWPVQGTRRDAFSHGFSVQGTILFPGRGRVRGRGTLGMCGMNGSSTGAQSVDLEYLAYGLSAGWQVAIGGSDPWKGPYLFSELRFDRETVNAKNPGTSWVSLSGSQGSRSCIRVGIGLGVGWVLPGSGLTFELEARASLTGPISSASESEQTHLFWAELPPDRYLRAGVGWTWGRATH